MVDLDRGYGRSVALVDSIALLHVVNVHGGGQAVALILAAESDGADDPSHVAGIFVGELLLVGQRGLDGGRMAVELVGDLFDGSPAAVGGADLGIEGHNNTFQHHKA